MTVSAGKTHPPLSLDPVIEALSTAPSLTSLHFHCEFTQGVYECSALIPCTGLRGPFLSLQQLEVSYSRALINHGVGTHAGAPVTGSLHPLAPLPALTHLRFAADQCSEPLGTGVLFFQRLLQQHSLQSAHLQIPRINMPEFDELEQSLRGAMPKLGDLYLRFPDRYKDLPDHMHGLARCVAQLTVLTRLDLEITDIDGLTGEWEAPDTAGWLLAPLGECRALRALRCRCARPEPADIGLNDIAFSPVLSLLSAAIPEMAHLTRLELACVAADGDTRELPVRHLRGLSSLKEVRHLDVKAVDFHVQAGAAAVRILIHLFGFAWLL